LLALQQFLINVGEKDLIHHIILQNILAGEYIYFLSDGGKRVVKSSEIKTEGSYAVPGLPVGPAKKD